MTKRSKACDIPPAVKRAVWERDGGRCVVCGSYNAAPNAHYISRAKGGLGIPKNIVTLCQNCHFEYDNGITPALYKKRILAHLKACYEDFDEEELIYSKWRV